MKHLDFILFFLLFPIMEVVVSYISTKEKILKGEETKPVNIQYAFFITIVWVLISIMLY